MNSLEAFHEAIVALQHRTSQAKSNIAQMEWPGVRKQVEVNYIDLAAWEQETLLRAYFNVFDDEQGES